MKRDAAQHLHGNKGRNKQEKYADTCLFLQLLDITLKKVDIRKRRGVSLLSQETDGTFNVSQPSSDFLFFSPRHFTALMFISSSVVVSECNGGKK